MTNSLKLFILILITMNFNSAFASDYVITVYDGVSSKTLLNAAHNTLYCKNLFSPNRVNPYSSVRVNRTASYKVDEYGRRQDGARGMQMQELNIESFPQVTDFVLSRIMFDWKKSQRFSDDSMNAIYSLHQRQSRHRTKIITTESADAANMAYYLNPGVEGTMVFDPGRPVSELFSAVRIVDTSPMPKAYGRRYKVPDEAPNQVRPVSEQQFSSLNLKQLYTQNGITPSKNRWSLGLIDVTGPQKSAIETLLTQVADLLDLHYNQRDFLSFGRTDSIKSDDVDIDFTGDNAIRVYYKRKFDIEPLRGEDGEFVTFGKEGKEFYIFHIKGSEFINKFFDLRFQSPLYGNNNAIRNEAEVHQHFREFIDASLKELDPRDYEVRNLAELFGKLEPIYRDYMLSTTNVPNRNELFASAFTRFLLLRRNLPDGIFDPDKDPTVKPILKHIQKEWRRMAPQEAIQAMGRDVPSEIAIIGLIEGVMQDPLTMLMNHTVKAQ